ncbi:MAG: calcium/sodium antiporter [Bacteroidales bacterium]|nr:calcium/sodium antiporter [Bacteroidales bacterium]
MIISIAYLIIGLILLVVGGNWLEKGSVNLSRHFGVSNLVAGLVITSLATSSPELFVNITSSLNGHSELALANVVGSNNVNILVVLGLSGLIFPIAIDKTAKRRDLPLSLVFTALLFCLANDFFFQRSEPSYISRLDGILFIICIIGYIIFIVKNAKDDNVGGGIELTLARSIILVIIGVAALVGGSNLMLNGSVDIAEQLGVSEKIIGLTIVAIGTSLPELATSIISSYHGNADLAMGNIIGSNIYNILLILGVSCTLAPIEYNASFNIELMLLMVATMMLQIFASSHSHHVGRKQGILLLATYVAYIIYTIGK